MRKNKIKKYLIPIISVCLIIMVVSYLYGKREKSLLVDSYVYSSAESFAAFCKGSKFAKIIGTATGGDGLSLDPAVLSLPNSGLVVRFSMAMGINYDGTVNEAMHTQPDIYEELSYEDYMKGIDTVLNRAIEECK